jgi:hypothetical protein
VPTQISPPLVAFSSEEMMHPELRRILKLAVEEYGLSPESAADALVSCSVDALMEFFPDCAVTVLVRNLEDPEKKLLCTTDEIGAVVKMVTDAGADWANSRMSGCEGGRQ